MSKPRRPKKYLAATWVNVPAPFEKTHIYYDVDDLNLTKAKQLRGWLDRAIKYLEAK